MAAFERFAELMLSHLLWTSLQAAVLFAIIALVLRLLPRLPAAARCTLWWLVALQVVLGLAWQSPISLPLLSPPAVIAQTGSDVTHADSTEAAGSVGLQPLTGGRQQYLSWREGLLVLWALAVLAQVPALVAERRRLRKLLRGAPPADAPLQQRCVGLAKRAGLRHCPRLRVSGQVEAPLVAGWWQPVILWPDRQELSMDETSLALAHELAHLKRGDLWLGIIPALARRLLFFHPLVRWAEHEYIAYREAACDAAAIRGSTHDARDYGALLLRLGVSDVRVAGISAVSGTFRSLKLRLTMLGRPAASMLRARVWIFIVAVAMLGALPYRMVAANGRAVVQAKTGAGHAHGLVKATAQCGIEADDIPFCGANFLIYMGVARNGQGAVLFDEGDVVIAGDRADVVASKRLYRPSARLLWFRRDGREYVARGAATLQRAQALVLPFARKYHALLALREQQSKLQKMRSALIAQQGNLTALQAGTSGTSDRAKVDQQARLEARIRALQAQIEAMHSSLHTQQVDLQQREGTARGKPHVLADGLAKLADDALASGSAQVVD